MRKLDNERQQQKQGRQKLLLRAIFMVVFILLTCQIFVSNLISSSGDKIQLLEQRHTSLTSQNEQIKKEIASVNSLSNLSHEASKLGLVKTNSVIYLETQVNVAMDAR